MRADLVLKRAAARLEDRLSAITPGDETRLLSDDQTLMLFSGTDIDTDTLFQYMETVATLRSRKITEGAHTQSVIMESLAMEMFLLGYFAAEEAALMKAPANSPED